MANKVKVRRWLVVADNGTRPVGIYNLPEQAQAASFEMVTWQTIEIEIEVEPHPDMLEDDFELDFDLDFEPID